MYGPREVSSSLRFGTFLIITVYVFDVEILKPKFATLRCALRACTISECSHQLVHMFALHGYVRTAVGV